MKAIQLTATGNPLETLKYVELPDPKAPKNGEVIIRMEYSPINFSDLMVAKGIYFIQPELPAVIGGEGVGVISEVGRDVTHLKVGDRVVLPFGTYAWSELVKAPAENLVALAPSADAKQASMIGINPPTAVLLLDEFTTLQENDWIVFNAGNSSVAHTFVTVAKSRKLKTLAIVRREDAVAVAKAAGADVVLVENSNIAEQANSATNSSTKPNVPTRSPTPSLTPIKSVITKETLLLRNTRKDIENKQTAKRYEQAWTTVVEDANGRYFDMLIIVSLQVPNRPT